MSRQKITGALIAAVTLAGTAALAAQPALAQAKGSSAPAASASSRPVSNELALFAATNKDGAANGQKPLQFDPKLLSISGQRARSQLGSKPLTHYDASGKLVFQQLLGNAHVSYGLAGENLARASNPTGDVTGRVEQALMKSPEHRANILDGRLTRVAIGSAMDPTTHQMTFAGEFRD
jgi:uncharacterized protein YkwD